VLTLDGVKFGDAQATMSGMTVAMYFLFLSWAQPLDKLSAERPHSSVFSPYMLLSIIGQVCQPF
jgi:cation-transporting ATPase 13A1